MKQNQIDNLIEMKYDNLDKSYFKINFPDFADKFLYAKFDTELVSLNKTFPLRINLFEIPSTGLGIYLDFIFLPDQNKKLLLSEMLKFWSLASKTKCFLEATKAGSLETLVFTFLFGKELDRQEFIAKLKIFDIPECH